MLIEEVERDPAAEFLAHYGVQGMKWGVRKRSRAEIVGARKETRAVAKNARTILKSAKQADKAGDSKAKAAAATKYKKEVLDKIKTPEFKEKYKAANSHTKGETAVLTLLSGPWAPLTYAGIKGMGNEKNLNRMHSANVGVAQEVLKELRSID